MSTAEVDEVSRTELKKAAEHLRWFVDLLDRTGQRSEIGHSAKKLSDAWLDRDQRRERLADVTEFLRSEIATLQAENESLREQLGATLALANPEPLTASDMETLVAESLPIEEPKPPAEEPGNIPLWALDMMNRGSQ